MTKDAGILGDTMSSSSTFVVGSKVTWRDPVDEEEREYMEEILSEYGTGPFIVTEIEHDDNPDRAILQLNGPDGKLLMYKDVVPAGLSAYWFKLAE